MEHFLAGLSLMFLCALYLAFMLFLLSLQLLSVIIFFYFLCFFKHPLLGLLSLFLCRFKLCSNFIKPILTTFNRCSILRKFYIAVPIKCLIKTSNNTRTALKMADCRKHTVQAKQTVDCLSRIIAFLVAGNVFTHFLNTFAIEEEVP